MKGRTCKQYIFRSCNNLLCPVTIYFQCYAFWWKSFHMPARKRRQKGLRVSDFALLLVGFKWYHGSEGVIVSWPKRCIIITFATVTSTNQSVILKEILHIVTMFPLLLLGQDLTSSSVSSDGAWSLSRSIWKHTTTCHHTPAMTCQHTHTSYVNTYQP